MIRIAITPAAYAAIAATLALGTVAVEPERADDGHALASCRARAKATSPNAISSTTSNISRRKPCPGFRWSRSHRPIGPGLMESDDEIGKAGGHPLVTLPGGNGTGGANPVVGVMLSVGAFARLTIRQLRPSEERQPRRREGG
jgi:hypothetical protein